MVIPAPNRSSVEGKLISEAVASLENMNELQEQARAHGPGAFFYYNYTAEDGRQYAGVCIVCPGDDYARCIPTDGSRGWSISGPREAPTISPSILTHQWDGEARQQVELWHGYMRAGRLESV